MKKQIFPAIKLTLITLLFFSGIYTIAVLAIAQAAPGKGKGNMVTRNGSRQYLDIGQRFTEDRYFNSRPSAVDYNAAGSGASNKSATNPEYLKAVAARIDTFLLHNPAVNRSQVPVELVTASGSGLDPHLSVKAAMIQVKRIASARKMNEAVLVNLVRQHTEQPMMGLAGPQVVNVLKINLALDQVKQ